MGVGVLVYVGFTWNEQEQKKVAYVILLLWA